MPLPHIDRARLMRGSIESDTQRLRCLLIVLLHVKIWVCRPEKELGVDLPCILAPCAVSGSHTLPNSSPRGAGEGSALRGSPQLAFDEPIECSGGADIISDAPTCCSGRPFVQISLSTFPEKEFGRTGMLTTLLEKAMSACTMVNPVARRCRL